MEQRGPEDEAKSVGPNKFSLFKLPSMFVPQSGRLVVRLGHDVQSFHWLKIVSLVRLNFHMSNTANLLRIFKKYIYIYIYI